MSADNAICVWPNHKSDQFGNKMDYALWYVGMIFMSPMEDDCMYLQNMGSVDIYQSREKALVAAHNRLREEDIVEYGVIESSIPDKPCGRCFVCVNERGLNPTDLDICDRCEQPIYDWQWKVISSDGTFHQSCEFLGKKGEMDKTI